MGTVSCRSWQLADAEKSAVQLTNTTLQRFS